MEGLKNKIREVIQEANELGEMILALQLQIQDGKLIASPEILAQLKKIEELQAKKHNYIEELKVILAEFERLGNK